MRKTFTDKKDDIADSGVQKGQDEICVNRPELTLKHSPPLDVHKGKFWPIVGKKKQKQTRNRQHLLQLLFNNVFV